MAPDARLLKTAAVPCATPLFTSAKETKYNQQSMRCDVSKHGCG